jgi:CheY-like chemotaxis protein
MEVQSEVGKGSVFRLILPVTISGEEVRLSSTATSSSEAPGRALSENSALAAATILVVEDDGAAQVALKRLIESRGLVVRAVRTVREAKEVFGSRQLKGVILDLGLGSGSGWELARWMRDSGKPAPPIIVHTGRVLTETEERELREMSQAVIIKGDRAHERLLDEVKLMLHQATVHVSVAPARHRDEVFVNRRVLVVDDDVRNIFALRALLGGAGMTVYVAENGHEALKVFNEVDDLDCIVMDLMMPGMDGLEATRQIRKLPRGADVPIIALTAKAMKEDRQACLDAGASDYLSKPVNNDELMGLIRVWMTR